MTQMFHHTHVKLGLSAQYLLKAGLGDVLLMSTFECYQKVSP